MIRRLGGIGVALFLATLAWSQEKATPPQPKPIPPNRVRLLDMRRAILLTNDGKKATDELNKRIAARNAELEKKQKELQDLQKQWEAAGADEQKRGELRALIEKHGNEF